MRTVAPVDGLAEAGRRRGEARFADFADDGLDGGERVGVRNGEGGRPWLLGGPSGGLSFLARILLLLGGTVVLVSASSGDRALLGGLLLGGLLLGGLLLGGESKLESLFGAAKPSFQASCCWATLAGPRLQGGRTEACRLRAVPYSSLFPGVIQGRPTDGVRGPRTVQTSS